jgi:hypothetical protein
VIDVFLLVGAVACVSLALTSVRDRSGRWRLATASWAVAALALIVAFAID